MGALRIFQTVLTHTFRPPLTYPADSHGRMRWHLYLFIIGILAMPILISGCCHYSESCQAKPAFEEANELFIQGDYSSTINKYEHILETYPSTGDRVLFEMGIAYSYPQNEQKDYQKSLECFHKLLRDYPGSEYRQNSESMIFYINNVAIKDKMIATQHAQIEALRHEAEDKNNELAQLQQKIQALEQKIFACAFQKGAADRIVIEKNARRMTLFSKSGMLKSYRIALGGNPVGPKERKGDNKTPEGTYVIDSRNRDSRYHRSLHISYPNENDKKRAKELGVSPGGDIMIHGIKKGFSWVGEAHADVDWTKGCIAVTDDEIEEIDTLVPNGTPVEIRP